LEWVKYNKKRGTCQRALTGFDGLDGREGTSLSSPGHKHPFALKPDIN
jgi:hypothetical protein